MFGSSFEACKTTIVGITLHESFFFTFLFVNCIHTAIFDSDSEMRDNITVSETEKQKNKNK